RTVRAPYKGLKPGESIAVNGACLTVERVVRGRFTVHAVETTTGRTLLGEYATGRRVNLERALRAADRLGGHFVQGHVDGVAVVERVAREGDAWIYDLRVPRAVRETSIPHGAITVDGVSLTINDLPGPDSVQTALIQFTRENEGDLVGAAETVTPEMINFMATHGRGLICLTLMPERCQALGLTQMAEHNTEAHETAFTVSIDAAARFGVTTGISAADRAATIRVAVDPASVPADLRRPGHVFPLRARPGGVLQRVGQKEASLDVARLAGLYPAGEICPILN